MGVDQGAAMPEARVKLISQLRARFFDGTAPKPREAILAALLEIADRQLDKYDRLASQALRVPGPSLMLLLDQFEEVFRPEVPPDARASLLNLIVDPRMAPRVKAMQPALRETIRTAIEMGLPVPCMMASLSYLDLLRAGSLPTNMTQAQRDYFGAHTYERTDVEGTFHSLWGEA